MPALISHRAANIPAPAPAKASWLPSWLGGQKPAAPNGIKPATNGVYFTNPLPPKPVPAPAPAPAPVAAARPYSVGDETKIVTKLSDALEAKVGKTNLSFLYFQTLMPTIISYLKKHVGIIYNFDEPFFTSRYEDAPNDGNIRYFIIANILKWGVLFKSIPLYDLIYETNTITEEAAPNLGQTYNMDDKNEKIILRVMPLDQSFIYSARKQQDDDAYDIRTFILKYFKEDPPKVGGYRKMRSKKMSRRGRTNTRKSRKSRSRKTRNRRHQ